MGVSNSSKTALFGKWLGGNMVVADQSKSTGRYIFVDSGSSTGGDTSGYGASPDAPMLTLDAAIGQCTANAGDVIVLMPGHAESLAAAADIVADVAGISIVGLGNGEDRPTFTFGTDVGADIDITANGVSIENCLFVAGIDSLTAPLHITGTDCKIKKCEFRDATDIEAVRWILTTAAADRLHITKCRHNGYSAGNASVNFARIVGADNCRIENSGFYGNYSTAVVEMHTTAATNLMVRSCAFLETGTSDFSKTVVDTVTGSVWSVVDCWDGVADTVFTGGDGSALAAADVGAVAAAITTVSTGVSTVQSKVDSTGVTASTVNSKADSIGTGGSTGNSLSESVGVAASIATSTAASVGIQVSTGNSQVASVGVQTSTADSKADSVGTAVSTGTSTGASVGIQASTNDSLTQSVGIVASTANSKVDSVATGVDSQLTSIGLIISLINSKT